MNKLVITTLAAAAASHAVAADPAMRDTPAFALASYERQAGYWSEEGAAPRTRPESSRHEARQQRLAPGITAERVSADLERQLATRMERALEADLPR